MTGIQGGSAETGPARDLLEARSRTLARRMPPRAATATQAYLVCACGADRIGLPLAQVARVLPGRPVTPLPGAPAAVLGLIALSGRVVSLLALGPALGRATEGDAATGHMVVMRGGTAPLAFAVDRVLGVADIPDGALDTAYAEAGLGAEAVSGYAPAGAGPGAETGFVAIDLPRLARRFLP